MIEPDTTMSRELIAVFLSLKKLRDGLDDFNAHRPRIGEPREVAETRSPPRYRLASICA
jgi:hypothetical protein